MLKDFFRFFERDREFNTRTPRKEFWRAALPDAIIWGLLVLFYFLFKDVNFIFIVIAALYLLDTFTARLALWFRRLHDLGISGAFSLVILIPVLGVFMLLFVFSSDSQPKNNAYGEYVKECKKPRG